MVQEEEVLYCFDVSVKKSDRTIEEFRTPFYGSAKMAYETYITMTACRKQCGDEIHASPIIRQSTYKTISLEELKKISEQAR